MLEYDDNIINDLTSLVFKKSSSVSVDDFSRPADELKSFAGTSPVFKRKVTTSLKKYRTGLDSGTKAIHEDTFLTGYNVFDVVEPPYNLDYLAKIYVSPSNSSHYAAVNAKVANVVGLGFNLIENSKSKRNLERMAGDKKKTERTRRNLLAHKEEVLNSIELFNDEDTFTETLTKVWRDYETMGNGYIEIGRTKDGRIGYIGHIPAQTIRIRRPRDGFVQVSGSAVQFFANFGHGGEGNPIGNKTPNEIIHLKKYSPISGYYGVPDIVSALNAVAGNEFAARFNLDYFENKAVPRHIITLKGAKLGTKAEQKLLAFFETSLKGQNHRSLFIPLPADTADSKVEFNIKAIESGVQDASFTNYRKSNVSDILMVHRVPITKISVADGASLALAKDADKTFKEQVIAPEQRVLEKKLNRIISELTDALDLKLNEMTLTDENTQSQIDERRRKTGTETANEQRSRRGQPTIDGGDELFDMNGKAKPSPSEIAGTVNRERDSQRSASATDSAGEARNPAGEGRTRGSS